MASGFLAELEMVLSQLMKDILAQLSGEHHRQRKGGGGKETNRKTKTNNIIKPSRRVGPVYPRGLLGKHLNKMKNEEPSFCQKLSIN